MSAPTIQAIRTAIAGVIAAVPGAGVVHDRERFSKDQAAFVALYVVGNVVRGWFIRRSATREYQLALGRWIVRHDWTITGYRSFVDADASELDFDTTVEAVRDAFRANLDLGGVVQTTVDDQDDSAGLQVQRAEPVMFGSALCHRVVCTLRTIHYV